jgi:hypothetical protein
VIFVPASFALRSLETLQTWSQLGQTLNCRKRGEIAITEAIAPGMSLCTAFEFCKVDITGYQ